MVSLGVSVNACRPARAHLAESKLQWSLSLVAISFLRAGLSRTNSFVGSIYREKVMRTHKQKDILISKHPKNKIAPQ
jgi:hypothetical protein